LWEMFEIPYNSPYAEWKAYTVKQKVMGGYRMPPPRAMPEEMVAVMELAWNHDPEKRPDATGLRKLLEEKYCSDDEQSKTKSVLKSRA
uniref:Pkinase_Tyr domain-containing protein n=1 Tax=Haemonchus placei TaxID=6290 RepID=A0A0N4XAD6_HAEPC